MKFGMTIQEVSAVFTAAGAEMKRCAAWWGETTMKINAVPINPATGEPYFTIPATGWGSGWVGPAKPMYRTSAPSLNTDKTVAVSNDVFWNEDMENCPRGCKVQLLGLGGVAMYGIYDGKNQFFIKWQAVPRNRTKP